MEDLREAVNTARDFVLTLIPEANPVQVEEVERDGNAWVVTLSFARLYAQKNPKHRDALESYSVFENRTYKTLRVEDGEVQSMKIRELIGA